MTNLESKVFQKAARKGGGGRVGEGGVRSLFTQDLVVDGKWRPTVILY
jgi:hypothetical protein